MTAVIHASVHDECIYAIENNDLPLLQRCWEGRKDWLNRTHWPYDPSDPPIYTYLLDALLYEENEHMWEWILEQDPEAVNRPVYLTGGETPLMRIARNPKGVEFLLKHGADVHAQDRWRQTALHSFCEDRGSDILPLLARGADEHHVPENGITPLSNALYIKHHQVPVLLNFRKLLALAHACDKEGLTPSIDLIRLLRPFLYNL